MKKNNFITYIDNQNNKSKKAFRLRVLQKQGSDYKLTITKYFKSLNVAKEYEKYTQKLLDRFKS